ncbi:MAG: CHAT domain-containing protein [Candidatus Tectimicrobiota bacterium]
MTRYLRWAILGLCLATGVAYGQSERDILKIFEQGYAAYQQGKYEAALASYEHALKLARREQFRQGITVNLIGTGFIYGLLGYYDKALPRLEEALRTARELKLPHEIATALHSLGAVYFFSSQYSKALAYFEEALQVPDGLSTPREIAAIQNSLGIAYGVLGDYAQAMHTFETALSLHQKLKNPQDVAVILSNIALLQVMQQRYEEAEKAALEADRLLQNTRTPWRGKAVLVEVYLATQRYAEALALLHAQPLAWQASDTERFDFLTQQGLAFKGNGRLSEATGSLLKAVALAEEMRRRAADRLAFFGSTATGGPIRAYRALVATLAERALQGEAPDPTLAPYGQSLAAAALYFAEATKARVLLESLAEAARQTDRLSLPAPLRSEEARLRTQLLSIADEWPEAYQRGEAAFKSLLEKKQAVLQEQQTFISRLRQEQPRYAALHYPQPLAPETLPLQRQEVLLEYALGEDATYLFRVRQGQVERVWRLPLGKTALEQQVQSFLTPLQQPGGAGMSAFAPSLGHSLYTLLLAEATQGLTPEMQLIIIPDGILGLLPFEALVVSPGQEMKSTRFVGELLQPRYYQSAAVFALLRTLGPSEAPRAFFALGDPIYHPNDPRYAALQQGAPSPPLSAPERGTYAYRGLPIPHLRGQGRRSDYRGAALDFPPLPETEAEVKTIAQLWGTPPQPPDVLLQTRANETQLRQIPLSRYRYLHFATHADLPGKLQGLHEPFLLLGQVENNSKDDGFLTLGEVLNFRLDAEMVVLSACMTGRGQALEGEGVANFARAFHQAGARSVVVSLWEVASEATEEYMKRFYRYLKQGKSKAEALALARQEIRALYPHPFFWAPFILHGEG